MSPQSTVPVEPLSADEERELREDIANDFLIGKYNNSVVVRLLATLDAARASRPVTATVLANLLRQPGVTSHSAGPGSDRTLVLHDADQIAERLAPLLAALPVREDEPTGIDVWGALDRLVPAYPEDDDDLGEIRRIVRQRQDARVQSETT